jgi:hypothetical protein
MHDYLNLSGNVYLRRLAEERGETMGRFEIFTDYILSLSTRGERIVLVVYITRRPG